MDEENKNKKYDSKVLFKERYAGEKGG